MKAAIVTGPDQIPKYGDFKDPEPQPGKEVVTVSAVALTNATKGRAAGSHYSTPGMYPMAVGVDGVGRTARGERVYFLMPEAPFGAMADKVLVRTEFCVPLSDGLDDFTAAALGNPGASSMAALKFRANFKAGETVLVNGATGSAGKLAVQIAKYLGAKKVVATGRDTAVLEGLYKLGADTTINLTLDQKELGRAIGEQFGEGIDVVLDYVFGKSAELMLTTAAKTMNGSRSLRYVEVGGVSGQEITLSAQALRAKPIMLMGSGFGSVTIKDYIIATADVMEAALPARLAIATRVVSLAKVEETWNANTGKDRIVFDVQRVRGT